MESSNDGGSFVVHHRAMKTLPTVVAVAACVVACSPMPPSAAPVSSIVPAPLTTLVAEANGLRLTASLDRIFVEPGGDVTVQLSLRNTRAEDVVFAEPCDTDAMIVEVPVPVEPIGQEWDGIAGIFKSYALEQSTGTPIESSIRTPLRTVADALPCHAPTRGEPGQEMDMIAAGDTYETTLRWSAELVEGLPAGPGDMPFSIQVLHDLEAGGGGLIKAETLAINGIITVLPGGPAAVSAGQAVDAALADPAFTAWLSKQPRDSWANANLYLQPGARGVDVLPEVPYWAVELFREPRNWAILYVDARNGSLLRSMYCDQPCDR